MTESPYKPPKPPPGAGGGHAPIPAVPVAARRRGAIPAAPVQLPRRPTETDADELLDSEGYRWAFQYRGHAGPAPGGENNVDDETPFRPAVELPEAHPLTVLFYQDTQTVQTSIVPTNQNWTAFTFDDTAHEGDGIEAGRVRVGVMGATVFIAEELDGSVRAFLEQNMSVRLKLTWGTYESFAELIVTDWEYRTTSAVPYLALTVTPDSNVINELDGPLENDEAVRVELFGMRLPNSAVRARVRYRNGKSEAEFDCDWVGGFQVLADRLELSRVRFAPDPSIAYNDAAIDVSATVIADAPRPGGSLSLTVAPVAVPTPTGVRHAELPIHPFARRVNLLIKYGNDEDAPGDAPLGQIFLAFVGKFDRSLCYIDAMSAREALFGPGLPVPAGVSKLVLSNRSLDDSVRLGVIWRLDI